MLSITHDQVLNTIDDISIVNCAMQECTSDVGCCSDTVLKDILKAHFTVLKETKERLVKSLAGVSFISRVDVHKQLCSFQPYTLEDVKLSDTSSFLIVVKNNQGILNKFPLYDFTIRIERNELT